MVRIEGDTLIFSFPEVHKDATLRVSFQRTLRIPDDDNAYPLPPGLGTFPLEHVDDHAARVSETWKNHGGVMLPMYQSEAMWLRFSGEYPMAVKVAAGKINAVTGEDWAAPLVQDPQDYMVTPNQPWLDGFVVAKGQIRQFVAMPLGAGYSVEEQLTSKAEHGGLQILVYPLKAQVWERMLEKRRRSQRILREQPMFGPDSAVYLASQAVVGARALSADMGLGGGGVMHQEIFEDHRNFGDWETNVSARCFVHLCNSMVWRAVTGKEPPRTPATAEEYTRRGLPWFDYYAPGEEAVGAQDKLAGIASIAAIGKKKGDVPLADNGPVHPKKVVKLKAPRVPGQVREGEF